MATATNDLLTNQKTSPQTSTRKIVTHDQWLAARKAFLAKEREFTHMRDELSRQRRELPLERVEKQYVFEGPNGNESLADLFAGRSQLVIYHFMFGPNWKEGCPSCSYLADGFDGAIPHLAARDTTFLVVSRAPFAEIEAFKKRMGWNFKWVSSFGSDFNYDYQVSQSKEEAGKDKVYYNYEMTEFPAEERPGLSVFLKDGGQVFHSYSSYARGLDILLLTYNILDLTPKGRDEDGLGFPMAWVRHHDKYAEGYVVNPKAGYVQPAKVTSSSCCSEGKL